MKSLMDLMNNFFYSKVTTIPSEDLNSNTDDYVMVSKNPDSSISLNDASTELPKDNEMKSNNKSNSLNEDRFMIKSDIQLKTESDKNFSDLKSGLNYLLDPDQPLNLSSVQFKKDFNRSKIIIDENRMNPSSNTLERFLKGFSPDQLKYIYNLHQGQATDAIHFMYKNYLLGERLPLHLGPMEQKATLLIRTGNKLSFKTENECFYLMNENSYYVMQKNKLVKLTDKQFNSLLEANSQESIGMQLSKKGYLPIYSLSSVSSLDFKNDKPLATYKVLIQSPNPEAFKYIGPETSIPGINLRLGNLRQEQFYKNVLLKFKNEINEQISHLRTTNLSNKNKLKSESYITILENLMDKFNKINSNLPVPKKLNIMVNICDQYENFLKTKQTNNPLNKGLTIIRNTIARFLNSFRKKKLRSKGPLTKNFLI